MVLTKSSNNSISPLVVVFLAPMQLCPLVVWGTNLLNPRDVCWWGVRAWGGGQCVQLLVLLRVMELLGALEARSSGSASQGWAGADWFRFSSVPLLPFPVLKQRHLNRGGRRALKTRSKNMKWYTNAGLLNLSHDDRHATCTHQRPFTWKQLQQR